MLFEYPLFQKCFVLVQGQIPVFGRLHNGFAPADGRTRMYQFVGAEGVSAGFALVAVGVFVAAMRTGSGDISVCQKLACFLVVILFTGFFDKAALAVEFVEKGGSGFMMDVRSGT